MRIDGPQVTSSLSLNGTTITDLNVFVTTGSLNGITGSYATTGSLNSFTSSATTRLDSIETSTSSLNSFTSSANSRLNSVEGVTGSYATTGSNLFKGNQTISGSVIPAVDNTYDLGSTTHQFRDLYLSSASLYIDGTKVLSSTTQELQITTDTGQSFKILEAGSDTITLQSADGNITLATSGGGDVILDPTTGVVALKGTTQVYAGNKVRSSDGNNIVFGDGLTVSGSVTITGFIEAQELRTTYISSSILYRSGSTKFGDELDDTHSFTGSLLVSGSISVPGSGLVSGSSQVLNGSGVWSGSAQLPSGVVSGSAQVDVMSTTNIAQLATTGSNTYNGNQIVSGSVTTTGNATFNGGSVTSFSTSGAGSFGNGVNIFTQPGTYTSGHGGIIQFQNEDVITAGIRGIRDGGSWGGSLLFYTHNTSSGNTFNTTFKENMRLTSAGSLGLGITTPTQKLHVFGDSDATKARFELYGTAGINEVLQIVNTANYNPNRGVKMGLYVNAGTNSNQLGAEIGSAVSDATSAYLFFSTTNAGVTSEAVRITSNGTTQFGTTAGYTTISQGQFFSKGGGSMFTANLLSGGWGRHFTMQRNDTTKYHIGVDGSDNFTVLNASDEYLMTLSTTGNGTFKGSLNIVSNGGTNPVLAIRQTNASTQGYDFETEDVSVGRLDLYGVTSTGRVQMMSWIKANGRVGIGAIAPRTKLQVTPVSNAEIPVLGTATGVATFTSANTNYGLQFNSTSDGTFHIQSQRFDNIATAYSLILNYAGGNIGIGEKTAPGCSLDVSSRTDAIALPRGTTAQRPGSSIAGMGRFNTEISKTEFYNGTVWVAIGGAGDGSTSSSAASSAKAIKAAVGNPTSGVYWLQIPNVNGGNAFQCYCDFTMDGGIGYAIIYNQYFQGAETGPSHASFGSSTITSAGFDTEYQISPTAMISNYGVTKLAVFARTGGSSGGGITGASYFNWVAFSGPTTTQYNLIFTNGYNDTQFTGTFNSSDGNTGTAYFPNSHGNTGGVTQITNGTTVNDNILYEYKQGAGTDPNHFWMVGNGRTGDVYWVVNNRYGSGSGNVMYNRWGGVALY